jgi:hypothetical protein
MFRPKSEAVAVGVESVLVPCRNGLTFGENAQVVFDIPRNLGFANLKNARLLTSVRLDKDDSAVDPVYIPDRIAGANIFIKRCTIRSNGVVLEENNNYYLWAKLHNSASLNEGIENKRTRLEGCAKSGRIQDSPYWIQNSVTANAANYTGVCRSVERQVEIPLLGGIFQKNTAFPLMAMPLEVELILEQADCVLSVADFANDLNCADSSGGGDTFVELTAAQRAAIAPIGAANQASEDANNNIISCFPWKTGQRVRFTGGGGISAAALAGTLTIASIELQAGGALRINLSGAVDDNATAATGLKMFSLSTDGQPLSGNKANYRWSNPRLVIPKVVPPPKFAQAMAEAIQKGQYKCDVISYIDYQNAIVGGTSASTNIIPADLSRVKSIISLPVDQQYICRLDTKHGLMGQLQGAVSYQFQINNILQPDRLVDLERESYNVPADNANYNFTKAVPPYALGSNIGGVHAYELEKALASANIPVRNMTFVTKTKEQDGCWALGRSLGPYGTSTNLMGISSILYLNYDSASPTYNANLKLLHNFVSHIRTFSITPAGVQVMY